MNSSAVLETLSSLLQPRISSQTWEWFVKMRNSLSGAVSQSSLLKAYTSATRQLGKGLVNPSTSEKENLQQHANGLVFDRWHCDDVGRAVFLIDLHSSAGSAYVELVSGCYDMGDSSEQTSWLRGLSLLPESNRFLATAIDSCRTNILPMFEAMACENPYSCRNFPELNFNQMVLKSLFNGIALSRIVGLESRLNQDLSRMANDYVSEREAAGRLVPADIWYVVAPHIQGDGLARVQFYLEHENPDHRRWAAAGLKLRKD